ncbi:hypothetical protein KPSA1_03460 [Pseudomonas syringae pv. actinidiae]|uniref:Uncharacterized protein n=1 Tax=Pseudomonas syringae pv. actinidiae TaxID=103796 RepID=A0A2V0QB30_PSESF|nr:hypothetical protein KPSA1_03460 [Pseudomonas syringae pv. actinidiae]
MGWKLDVTIPGICLMAPGAGLGTSGAATTTIRSLAKHRPTRLLSGAGLMRIATSNCSSTRSTRWSSATASMMTSG